MPSPIPFVLATVSQEGGDRYAAMVIDNRVISLSALNRGLAVNVTGAHSILAVLEDWEANLPRLIRAADHVRSNAGDALRTQAVEETQVTFHPPVDLPRQFICTGANYRKHVIDLVVGDPDQRGIGVTEQDPAELRRIAEKQMDERAANATPYCFVKLPTTMIGAQDQLIVPKDVKKVDWELELAVVIGRRGRRIPAAHAMRHVAGYAVVNDVTARELIFRPDVPALATDWLSGKCLPTFSPFGPYLVPAAFVSDPYDLNIRLSVNDRVMQNETTGDMLISIERQIEYISSRIELLPGDVIATGSPAGNGSHYGIFLKPGDVMVGEITGLGGQRIVCVAE